MHSSGSYWRWKCTVSVVVVISQSLSSSFIYIVAHLWCVTFVESLIARCKRRVVVSQNILPLARCILFCILFFWGGVLNMSQY